MLTAIVTGASSGIGSAAAVELARRGVHVVAAGRSPERTTKTVDAIVDDGGSASFLELDLASLDSCRQAAQRFVIDGRPLDILINNAGVGVARGVTAEGFEIHFGVNHLGHFMFTRHLIDAFAPRARIITVTSEVHRRVEGIDFTRLCGKTRSLFGLDEYGVSKLANILYTRELARRRPEWRAYAVHPGFTNTNIIPSYARPFLRGRLITPDQGADTVVWCATADEVEDQSGHYYSRRKIWQPSAAAQDDDLGAELWSRSVSWCGPATDN